MYSCVLKESAPDEYIYSPQGLTFLLLYQAYKMMKVKYHNAHSDYTEQKTTLSTS